MPSTLGIVSSSRVYPPRLRSYITYDLSDPSGKESPFSLEIPAPPSVQDGDLMLAVFSEGRSTGEGTISTTSGWSKQFTFNYVDPNFYDAIQMVGFTRFFREGDPLSYNFTHNLIYIFGSVSIMVFSDAAGIHGADYNADYFVSGQNMTQVSPSVTASSSEAPLRLDVYSSQSFFAGESTWDVSTYSGPYDAEFSQTTYAGGSQVIVDYSGSIASTSMNFQSIGSTETPGMVTSLLIDSKY